MKDDTLFPAQYILNNCDVLKAVRACGFSEEEYSDRAARQQGVALLQREDIQEQLYEIRKGVLMSATECLQRLSEIARGETANDVCSDDGEIDIERARATGRLWMVQEFKTTITAHGTNRSIKIYSAIEALKVIAKHHGLLDNIFGRGNVPKDLRKLDEALKAKLRMVRFQGGAES